jgi:RNA polymerase sigma-19 factor, ECF subfamily
MSASQDILEKLQQKDIKSFELVFHTYYPELCRFAQKYIPDQLAAEDLVQDLFVNLWNNLGNLMINTSLKSYLYACVRNSAFNAIKHQKVVDRYEGEIAKDVKVFHDSNELEVDELQQHITEAINKLPDRCREVFQLSRNEGLKYAEIAIELQISVKTVEVQMGKALKTLRSDLGSYLPLYLLIWFEYLN